MNINGLLQKLFEIERSIGSETNTAILNQVLDAENCLLEMQREMIESLRNQPRDLVIRRIADAPAAA